MALGRPVPSPWCNPMAQGLVFRAQGLVFLRYLPGPRGPPAAASDRNGGAIYPRIAQQASASAAVARPCSLLRRRKEQLPFRSSQPAHTYQVSHHVIVFILVA